MLMTAELSSGTGALADGVDEGSIVWADVENKVVYHTAVATSET